MAGELNSVGPFAHCCRPYQTAFDNVLTGSVADFKHDAAIDEFSNKLGIFKASRLRAARTSLRLCPPT